MVLPIFIIFTPVVKHHLQLPGLVFFVFVFFLFCFLILFCVFWGHAVDMIQHSCRIQTKNGNKERTTWYNTNSDI